MADARHLHVELLPLGPGHGLNDRLHRGDHVVEGELIVGEHHLAALNFGHVQDVVDEAEQVLAGGHDFAGVLPHLGRVFRLLGQQSGEAQHRVHGRADIVGHIGQKRGFRGAGNLGGLERLGQLLAVEPTLLLPLLSHPLLLPPVEIIQQNTQEKRSQHDRHHHCDVLIHRPALLLDGFNRHIAH